ncbi:hypothetical protein ACTFIR_003923 [Dictyostelium discoideum]
MEIESIEYSTNNTINPSTGYSLVVLNKCLSKLDNNNLKDKFEILWFKNQQQQFPASKSFILNNKLIRALISKKVHYVEPENEKEIEGFGTKIGFEKHEVDDEHKDKNEEEDEGVEDDDEEVKEGDSEENEEEEDDHDDYDEVNQEDDDYDDEDDKDNHQKLLAKLAPQIKLWFYIYLRLLILDIPTMLEYIKNDERSRRGEEKAELLLCTSKPNLPPPLSCTIITPHPHDIHDMAVPYREL